MTRDNVLFILIGILVGFIAGYLMREVMASRQPARLMHGAAGVAAPARPGGGGGAPAPEQSPGQARSGPGDAQAVAEEMRQLENHLESNPDDAQAALRLANLAYDSEAWQVCVASYERYLTLVGADPDVLSDLGVCYRETGRPDEALGAFERAQKVAPDHWQSRYNEVVILAFDLEEFERAERVLDELRALQPNNPDIESLAAEVERRRSS